MPPDPVHPRRAADVERELREITGQRGFDVDAIIAIAYADEGELGLRRIVDPDTLRLLAAAHRRERAG